MEDKIDIIDEFETEPETGFRYVQIAQTKDGKITFYRSKEQYFSYQTGPISNTTFMVARCSRENMKSIINSKLDENQYYVKGKNVYLQYTEDDFDKTEADEMKKHIQFPLYLDYSRICELIFDYNIDKDIADRITSIVDENDENETRKIDTNNNSLNKNKTAQQQPYYQQVWNKVFGGCCPCGLDTTKQEQELKND